MLESIVPQSIIGTVWSRAHMEGVLNNPVAAKIALRDPVWRIPGRNIRRPAQKCAREQRFRLLQFCEPGIPTSAVQYPAPEEPGMSSEVSEVEIKRCKV